MTPLQDDLATAEGTMTPPLIDTLEKELADVTENEKLWESVGHSFISSNYKAKRLKLEAFKAMYVALDKAQRLEGITDEDYDLIEEARALAEHAWEGRG